MLKRLTGHPMVRSVYRVSGEDCFVAEVVCRRIEDVSAILDELKATRAVQSSRTAFVLEAVMEKGLLGPLEPELVDGAERGAPPRQARAAIMTAERRKKILPWVSLAIIYVVWGSTYMAIRIVVHEHAADGRGGVPVPGGGDRSWPGIAAIADRRHGWPSRRQWADYAFVGVLLLAVGNGLVMWSEKRIPSSIAALIVGQHADVADPVRRLPRHRPALDGAGLDGNADRPAGRGARRASRRAASIPATGRRSWPCWGRRWPGPRERCTRSRCRAGCPCSPRPRSRCWPERSPWARCPWPWERTSPGSRTPGRDAWLGLAYLTVFGSLVAFTAFAYCINELPATTVGTYAYVNPVVAVILGAAFLDERVTSGLLAGGALILVAVIVTTMGRARRRPPSPAAAEPERA